MGIRLDVMTDIETLGTKSDSTIFQISAIAFDIKTGEHYNTFNVVADIEKNNKLTIDGSTLKWWLNTDKELLSKLLNSGTGSSDQMIFEFHNWLNCLSDDTRDVHLWGNGILFDNKMIEHQMELLGLKYPIFYRNDRDMRTLMDLACQKVGMSEKGFKETYGLKNLVAHDAFDDVKWQIDIVVKAYHLLINAKSM